MNLKIILGLTFFLYSQNSFSFQSIDLNNASAQQIMMLSGIGEKLAKRIVSFRKERGGFSNLNDLLSVDGCKSSLLEKIRDQVSFNTIPNSELKTTNKIKLNNKKISDEELSQLISEYKFEPTIKTVLEKAVNYAHAHPKQISSWLTRIRNSAWAPKLSAPTGRDFDKDISVRSKSGTDDISSTKGSINWKFDVKAEWRLGDLIFNHDEIYIARESVRQTLLRQEIVKNVTRIYFNRRQEQVLREVQNTKTNIEAALLQELQIQELTAQLDGFTGGWFTEQIHAMNAKNT